MSGTFIFLIVNCQLSGISLFSTSPSTSLPLESVNRIRHFDDISEVPFQPVISPLFARIFSLTGKNFFPDWENNFL